MSASYTPSRRAFSLVELLVVIAILATLIAILLPALGGSRTAARQLQALANGRTVGQSFTIYTGAYKGHYPYGEASEDPNLPGGGAALVFEWYPRGAIVATSDVFDMEWAWPAFLKEVAPWEENYAAWVSPGLDTDLPSIPDLDDADRPSELISWRYSNSFIADPRLWSDEPGDAGMRAIGAAEVVFPASKVLLWDTHLAYLRQEPDVIDGHWDAPTPMAFADGHCDANLPREASDPVANPLRFNQATRLHDTRDGVRGVDY